MSNLWQLSPSDLTFLWDECPRCFYLKVVRNFRRPWTPFPKIFNRIDKLMKDHYENKPTSEISLSLPEGVVKFGERWVTSQPIIVPNHHSQCFIKGKFDSVIEFSDGTYGIIDFKTSEAKPEHVPFYARQLQAYAYALEHPAQNCLSLSPISVMGLLCVEPVQMGMIRNDQIAYFGALTWLECPNDGKKFIAFIDEVLGVLEQESPPPGNTSCTWCQYRNNARKTDW